MNNLTNTKEEWATIQNFSKYLVSTEGRVFSTKTKKMLVPRDCVGYSKVMLVGDDKVTKQLYIHRLVLTAFEGESIKPIANHLNGDRSDNRLKNLEWSTAQENARHAITFGLRKVSEDYNLFIDAYDVEKIREKYTNSTHTIKEIAEAYVMSYSQTYSIVNNKSWKTNIA